MSFINFGSSVESLIEKRQVGGFSAIKDIHASFLKQDPKLGKSYIITLFDYCPSKVVYAVYVKKGLIVKDYEFDENLTLNAEQYFALRQYYFDCHAAAPNLLFNILEIKVDWDSSGVKVYYRTQYFKDIDPCANGNTSVSRLSGTTPAKLDTGAVKFDTKDSKLLPTEGDDSKGFMPIR
jgi:hypothetical protein